MVHPAFEPYILLARESPDSAPTSVGIDERRRTFRAEREALRGEPALMAAVNDRQIELKGRTLAARLYEPLKAVDTALVVYFHGGGFVVGDLETHDWLCRRLAFDTGARLLAIDYRLAPEHPFPAALDDAADVVRYASEHREEFGVPGAAIIMMGDSAGANLVTVAARHLRDERVNVTAQVLIYPTLGPELVTDSAHRFGTGYLLDLEALRRDYSLYLNGFVDHTDPRVTPLLSNDLSGVAPAVVLVAQCDPLRDEGVAYAGLLEHFAVPVELLEAEEMVHGFLEMGAVVPDALAILDDLAEHVHRFVDAAS
jgi:acetyl esterase